MIRNAQKLRSYKIKVIKSIYYDRAQISDPKRVLTVTLNKRTTLFSRTRIFNFSYQLRL